VRAVDAFSAYTLRPNAVTQPPTLAGKLLLEDSFRSGGTKERVKMQGCKQNPLGRNLASDFYFIQLT
jgi:hypothetical protein